MVMLSDVKLCCSNWNFKKTFPTSIRKPSVSWRLD